jgi:hypothetical protein
MKDSWELGLSSIFCCVHSHHVTVHQLFFCTVLKETHIEHRARRQTLDTYVCFYKKTYIFMVQRKIVDTRLFRPVLFVGITKFVHLFTVQNITQKQQQLFSTLVTFTFLSANYMHTKPGKNG